MSTHLERKFYHICDWCHERLITGAKPHIVRIVYPIGSQRFDELCGTCWINAGSPDIVPYDRVPNIEPRDPRY